MYFYFSAEYPAVLKINGQYMGVLDKITKPFRFEKERDTFVEICALREGIMNAAFVVDGNFPNELSKDLTVTDLKGGYLIRSRKKVLNGELRIFGQEHLGDAAVTVYRDGGSKICIETRGDFLIDNVSCETYEAKIEKIRVGSGEYIIVALNDSPKTLYVYSADKKITLKLNCLADEYGVENGFYTVLKHSDIAKHTVKTVWKDDGAEFTAIAREVTADEDFCAEKLHANVLPYAFFEGVMLGENTDKYLDGKILENAHRLREYLGEFIGVTPPPQFRKPTEIGLIYKENGERYRVEYYTVETAGGKITNVSKSEN